MPQFTRTKSLSLLLGLACSFALLAACNGPMAITPAPKPSTQPGAVATPPPIPEFPSQGPLPTAMPGAAGEGRMFDGDMASSPAMAAPMAPAPAGAVADGGGGPGGSGGSASSESAAKPSSGMTRPGTPGDIIIDPIMPEPMPPQIRPESGLLTAGEWDDHAHWSFWLDLLEDQEFSAALTPWGIDTRQRVTVKLTGGNGPLADAPVQLLAGGAKVFEARTNTNGEAHLFANLLSKSQSTDFSVKAALGETVLTAEVNPAKDQTVELKTDAKLEPAVNADLMLTVDTTGSMGDEMEYLKQELQNVASRIVKLNRSDLKLRMSANFYKDTTDSYVVRSFPFTEDIATVSKQLSEQSASGGGDFPEAVDVAMADAVDEHKWSPTARARLMFLVLDAPAHQTEDVLKRLRTSLTRAAAKGIRIIPVASSGIDKETEAMLRQMAIVSGGRYVFITDDSGIGGGHIKPTIGDHKVEKLNDLMVRIATEYITGDAPAPKPISTAAPTPEPEQTQTPQPPEQQ